MLDTDRFNNLPKVKNHKLNVLPTNPETADPDDVVGPGRFPSWLHRPLPKGNTLWNTGKIIRGKSLPTVCEEAKCPNLVECWTKGTATFLAMGHECTRSCGFCSIDFNRAPKALDDDEPARIAESVKELGLKHVVITMVARDDLADGGASHLARIVAAIKECTPGVTVELLTSDLAGKSDSIDIILEARPDVFNHNIETVRELTPRVRHTATYDRTLEFLKYAKEHRKNPQMVTKSGLMVGLGETQAQVHETLKDLANVGVDIVTIGQYLQANRHKLRVKTFVTPEQFKEYELFGQQLGIRHMYCGPFVRSSYNADLITTQINSPQTITTN
jgi:lipoic acid synthetase